MDWVPVFLAFELPVPLLRPSRHRRVSLSFFCKFKSLFQCARQVQPPQGKGGGPHALAAAGGQGKGFGVTDGLGFSCGRKVYGRDRAFGPGDLFLNSSPFVSQRHIMRQVAEEVPMASSGREVFCRAMAGTFSPFYPRGSNPFRSSVGCGNFLGSPSSLVIGR